MTAVLPFTLRMLHPSMVVGLVSGTGAGLWETFGRSSPVGLAAPVACFVESVGWRPRLEVSCALPIAVAIVFADEPSAASRSDFAPVGSAEDSAFLTASEGKR